MATGVKPRDEDVQFTRTDLEAIQDAMKNQKFRDLLAEYCEEVRDPANQALYQKEMTQLEKERGYDVTFINPKGGYVIKTSVAGDRKAFINICSNDNVEKPSCKVQVVDGTKGMNWQVPYSLIPPRDDYDHKKERCVIYDVVFHPDTLRMAEQNRQFRDLVNNTAFDALQKNYNIHLDKNNFRFPKSAYKGMVTPAVIRKEDPNYQPKNEEESEDIPQDIMDKLYPQHVYSEPQTNTIPKQQQRKIVNIKKAEFSHSTENGYTVPKYVIKQQKNIDFQDYTFHRDSKQYSAIPSQIVVEINLPLLHSTQDCTLDVQERKLSLVSEKPAKYQLNITLPYAVNDQCGTAKFDKSKRMLIVSLPVIRKHYTSDCANSKVDSGVESEENSGSQSDDDKENLIEVLSSTPANVSVVEPKKSAVAKQDMFLEPSLGYMLPPYTHNALDDTVAFTFHVKNTEPDSVKVKQDGNKIHIKFTSIGSGYVPVHYSALVVFDQGAKFENISGEAWDNNVILQLDAAGIMPKNFQIGLSEESLTSEQFEVSSTEKTKVEPESTEFEETPSPVIEVTNRGTETNIHVSTNDDEELEDDAASSKEEKKIVWTGVSNSFSSAKSILRKSLARSISESSVGDMASSMDYISSDCIPEESSLKKTVRFSDVIAKQFYRSNSSIEGQKKKNQRKKSKKRTLERRKSESEAEDDHVTTNPKNTKPKSVLKQRRDSGLTDTSDAETDTKSTPESHNFEDSRKSYENKSFLDIVENNNNTEPAIWESDKKVSEKQNPKNQTNPPKNCDNNIEHKTGFYDPDKLNKGQYLEVKFKNDLIFDLDM